MIFLKQSVLIVCLVSLGLCQTGEAASRLDSMRIHDQKRLNCARTIAISIFPDTLEAKGLRVMDEYQREFARKLCAALTALPGIEKADLVEGTTPVMADILIQGRFKTLSAESNGLRNRSGFDDGKSYCHIGMKGVDAGSGSQVFSIEHTRESAADIVTDDDLTENIEEAIKDVAAWLKAARGTCSSGKPQNRHRAILLASPLKELSL